MDTSWLGGFLTGVNFHPRFYNVTTGTEMSEMLAWLDNYCEGHPSERVGDAAQDLVLELARRRGASQ